MKKLILLITIILGMIVISCTGTKYQYDMNEIEVLISMGQATKQSDSIVVGNTKYPIVIIDEDGYYPSYSLDGDIKYYRVDKY